MPEKSNIKVVDFQRELFNLQDIWQKKSNVNISLNDKIDLTVGKFYLLYGQRSLIQNSLEDLCHRLHDNSSLDKPIKFNSKDKTLDPLEIEKVAEKIASESNIKDYQRRYKVFRPLTFNKQKSFLKALCIESRKKGTNVLLVDMPLGQEIRNLIPTESYCAYNQALAEISKLPGVSLLDLGKNFPDKFFVDLVHLNARGGNLLNKLIADTLLGYDRHPSIKRLATSKNQNAPR